MRQQAVRILTYLVEHADRTVSREELRATVWPSGTFVEFESGLYTAVNQMRQALGDSATKPHYVETVPKVGYRFISPVHLDGPRMPEAAPAAPAATTPGPVAGAGRSWFAARRGTLLLMAGAVAVLASIEGVRILRERAGPGPPVLDHLRPFTTGRGSQDHAAFSPSGEMIAFDWQSETDPHTCIYVQRLDSATPAPLSGCAGLERRPVWSPDGTHVAFLRDSGGPALTVVSAPLYGQGEKKLAEFSKGATPWFDWSHDGKWLAIAAPGAAGGAAAIMLISTATGEYRTITHPPADWRGDSLPLFSPDSKRVAFRRTMLQSGADDLYEASVEGGKPKQITFQNRAIGAFAFTSDAGLLISAKLDASVRTLWWLGPHSGRMTRLTPPVFDATSPAESRDGKHLAFSKVLYDVNVWRLNADGRGEAAVLIDSRLPDIGAQYSPDGRRIVFQSTRSGTDDLWICDANGANAVRLVEGWGSAIGNPKWSPDGRHIAFEWHPGGKAEIYVIAVGGGAPQKLVANGDQNSMPSWSRDGQFVYFSVNPGGARRIYKVPAAGGAAISIRQDAGLAPAESPDGRSLYFFRDTPTNGEVWRQSLRDGGPVGEPERVLAGLRQHDWGNWAVNDRGIYYVRQRENRSWVVEYRDLTRSAIRIVYVLRNPPIWASAGLAVSPDGQTLLLAQVDQDDSNLFWQ
jgi:Tol biopolymer transport system component